jgi:hypothetical protein
MHNNILNTVTFICIFLSIASVSGKYRGVATNSWDGCEDLNLLSNMAWYYSWSLKPISTIENCSLGGRYIEFVPMVHKAADVPNLVANLPPGTKHLMSFNEPNFSFESNLSPAEAATLWLDVEQQLSNAGLLGKIKLGAPSASPGGDLMSPQQWLTWFHGNCSACHFDFQCFHIYDCNLPYYDAGSLNYWISVASSFGLPVWLTEFNCPSPPGPDMEIQWMTSVLQSLDNNPNVSRYSWFTTRASGGFVGSIPSLLTSTNPSTLTPIGQFYNSGGDLINTQTTSSTSTQVSSGGSSSSNTVTSTSTASSNTGTSSSKSSSSSSNGGSSSSTSTTQSSGSKSSSGSSSKSTSTQSYSSSSKSSSSSSSQSKSSSSSSSASSSSSTSFSNSNTLHILTGVIIAFQLLL